MTATQNTPTQAQPRKPRRKAVTQPTAESVLADLQGLARDMAADDVAQRAPQSKGKGRARKAAAPAVEEPTPTPSAPGAVNITITHDRHGDPEAHLTGCRHLELARKRDPHAGAWTVEVTSLDDVTFEVWGASGVASDSFQGDPLADPAAYRAHTLATMDAPAVAPCARKALTPPAPRKARKAATPAVEAPTPTPAPRKALPQAERRTEATHADGGSAVAHGKCTSCGARKGHLCQSKLGKPTNFVHSPRMRAWEAAGSPRPAVPFLSPLSKAGKAAAAAKAGA